MTQKKRRICYYMLNTQITLNKTFSTNVISMFFIVIDFYTGLLACESKQPTDKSVCQKKK